MFPNGFTKWENLWFGLYWKSITCQKRNIQCSDFDNDSTSCPNAKLPDKSIKCIYNSKQFFQELHQER